MYTVTSVVLEGSPTNSVISPRKHGYQFLKQDRDSRAIVDSSSNTVLAFMPPPRIPWSQFKREHSVSKMTIPFGDDIVAMEYRDHVMELQLFYDSRIPGWELVTELGGIGGSEVFSEGDHDGKTVRQVFCSVFSVVVLEDEKRLPFLLDLLPTEFTFCLQMSMKYPVQLHLTDILSILVLRQTTFVTSTYLSLYHDISALKHMPFEVSKTYGWFPTDCPVILRSKSTGQSTVFQHPTCFAQCLIREIPAKLLFRFLCLRSAGQHHVQEYVRLFPKYRKTMRLCRHAVSTWIGQVQQSYYNVHVVKTQTLCHIPPNHIPLVRDLHTLYRASAGKTPITFAVVEDWVYHHCHAEDVFGYCSPYCSSTDV
jgi:hypothetical protein